jgi:hypothetical protein
MTATPTKVTTSFPVVLTDRQTEDLETAIGDRGDVYPVGVSWNVAAVHELLFDGFDGPVVDPARLMLAYCVGVGIEQAIEADTHGEYGTEPVNTRKRLETIARRLGLTDEEMEI